MNGFTRVALVTLFVTCFTLFLGWIHLGVLIPQALFVSLALVTHPKAFVSRSMLLFYLYYVYQYISGLVAGIGFDITILAARFFVIAVPLIISSILFTPGLIKDCRGVSKYAIVISFITVILSIRILVTDRDALRLTSMANSIGDWPVLYGYWRRGMADYAMAAMLLFMPVVLICRLKSNANRYERLVLWLGIITVMVFMYLGQVTTTFTLCIIVTLISFLNVKNRFASFFGIGLMALFVVMQFSGIMDFATSFAGEGAMNERFASIADAAKSGTFDDASDAGTRWALIEETVRAFIAHPLFGSSIAKVGGHNYFLDLLAKYGIIGCLPFFLLILNQFKVVSSYMTEDSKRYYLIILVGFIFLGLIKNMSGTEYWNYLFIYYPAILVWFDSKKLIKR